ncbi:alpha/beta fold hydrolase [Streptomyces sp. HSW2009]|uniref:esterase/lipase family protein n=1 Tax=Streptomyces sp. HSW2009 TaxID=3142890 RepID=UPI0032EDB42D
MDKPRRRSALNAVRRSAVAVGTALCLAATAAITTTPAHATPPPTSEASKPGQPSETNQPTRADQPNETNPANRANRANQPNETNAANESNPATRNGHPPRPGHPTARASAAYPVGGLPEAVRNFLLSPGAVAGANDWRCKPSAEHPYPVVLVHATGVNLGANWTRLAPTLANAGHCVFALNYGMNHLSLGRIGGLGDIRASAGQLSAFVDRVLAATGARKVNLVGHSQGGMMPHYYLKRLHGAAKVHTLVALSPSNHGTTLSGLTHLGEALGVLGFVNDLFDFVGLPALRQQEVNSRFQHDLYADGDTVPGVRYVVLQTTKDAVVTPYANAFLRGDAVRNVTIQDQCPADPVGHVGMFVDGPAVQHVVNALGPDDPNFTPTCRDYGPPL